MKTAIRLVWLSALAFIGFANSAQGQGVESVTLPVSVVTAGSTSNVLVTLDTRKQENVSVQLTINQTSATNATPLVLVFDKSVDGSNWGAADTVSWSHARTASTNSQTFVTNISVSGFPYIRLKTIQNLGSVGDVNIEHFKYFVKFIATR